MIKIILAIILTTVISSVIILTIPFDSNGRLFHRLAKLHGRAVLFVCGVKIALDGLDSVDFSKNYIYISNHASQFDIPAIIAGIPGEIRLVYKKELEKIPFIGWGLKFGKTYISINRKGHDAIQSLEEAARKIRDGTSVVLFAEGTRSPDGKLQPFKRGPFMLAVQAGIPVVPLTIRGSYNILPKHSLRIRPGEIRLILTQPIEPQNGQGKEAEILLRDKVYSIIKKNLEEV